MNTKQSDDQYSAEETAERFHRAVKKSLNMLPYHHESPSKKKKNAAQKSRVKKPKPLP